jgi:DNA-binding transcriptional ArsR family regulator
MTKKPDPSPPSEPAPGASFRPAENIVISTIEQLKAISDPLRLNILELVAHEALTVRQVASRLGQPPTRLYYHVAELEKAGLVSLVDTRVKSGIIEKYYRTSADHITIDHKLLNAGEDQETAIHELLSMVFDSTAQEIIRSLAAGLVNWQDVSAGKGTGMVLTRSIFQIRRERLPRLVEKITALLEEMAGEEQQPGPDSASYGCTIAFYPRISAEKAGQD